MYIDYADKSYSRSPRLPRCAKRIEEAQAKAREHAARAQANRDAFEAAEEDGNDVVTKETERRSRLTVTTAAR